MQTDNIAARLQQLHNLQEQLSASHVTAVSVSEVWLTLTFAQFATENSSVDETTSIHAGAALHQSVTEVFSAYSCAPPATYTTFTSLSTDLILKYGLTQAEKDAPLLAISELCDRKPSALLRCMDSLVSSEDGSSSLSISMPHSVLVAAAEVSSKDIADSPADDLLAPHMSSSTINQQVSSPLAPTTSLCWTMSKRFQVISIEHDDTVSMEQLAPHLRHRFPKSASSLGGAMWRTPTMS